MTIDSSLFVSNSAENGGSIYLGQGQSNITYSQFKNNTATNGGVIYSGSVLNIVASKFDGNNATNAGAIYSTNSLTIKGGGITNNNADYGSGIYNSGILNLSSVFFINNIAKIIEIDISAPISAKSGSNIIIEGKLLYGDNVANVIYTTNGNLLINNEKPLISNYPSNKKNLF